MRADFASFIRNPYTLYAELVTSGSELQAWGSWANGMPLGMMRCDGRSAIVLHFLLDDLISVIVAEGPGVRTTLPVLLHAHP